MMVHNKHNTSSLQDDQFWLTWSGLASLFDESLLFSSSEDPFSHICMNCISQEQSTNQKWIFSWHREITQPIRVSSSVMSENHRYEKEHGVALHIEGILPDVIISQDLKQSHTHNLYNDHSSFKLLVNNYDVQRIQLSCK
ncbi:hypothetical protein GOODEAATRI_025647 [Goodea atripinnis]|uniref:Leptin receptor n=1 Tax=Goodea atripinnis TaxID=208336 RepID=A0ABV0P179_9TELE